MELAAVEINAKPLEISGKRYKVKIVALDDKYNPAETRINVQRLVQQHKTAAVLVPHSGGVFAVQAFNEKSKVLLLAYTNLTQVTERGNKLTIRIPPDFIGYIMPFTKAMMAKHGTNVAMVQADHDYAKAWSAAFKPVWEAQGDKDQPELLDRACDRGGDETGGDHDRCRGDSRADGKGLHDAPAGEQPERYRWPG